ncbi:MAG: hypothetical protein AAF557_19215 [Pseudomonadota bacterium]
MKSLWAVLLMLVFVVLSGQAARADEVLNGLYFGVDDAAGASIRIEPDPQGFMGTFFDRHGNSQNFEADRVEDSAEAVLDMDGQTVLLRVAPLPFGAQVSLVPFNAQGNLELEFARSLNFVKEGVQLPEQPIDFVPAPRSDCNSFAGNSFLQSYQFWEPSGVVNGYVCLPERFKTLIRMFPAVHLDVIWKLCLAPQSDRALGVALQRSSVDCAQVRNGIAEAQRAGKFDFYKSMVNGEKDTLRTSVRCADGYLSDKTTCNRAAEEISKAAVSLRTPAMVLQQIR